MLNKQEILNRCIELVTQRIQTAEQAMKAAQESANSEDKSSAGDKYETSRAMGHLDRDMNAKQLMQAKQELAELYKIDLAQNDFVKMGSIIMTPTAAYFIAVGLGTIFVGEKSIIILSPKSPLALLMLGKQKGDQFTFNQKQLLIESVY